MTATCAPRPAHRPDASLDAGRWLLVPSRSRVAFSGRASRLAPTFAAAFPGVRGGIDLDDGSLDVELDVSAVTTGNRAWDDLLRSIDPFDARRHPVAAYRAQVRWDGSGAGRVDGELSVRGVSRRVPLDARLVAAGRHEVRLRATGTVDRRDLGVRCDLPGIGRLVPDVLQLDIGVTAVRVG